MKDMISLFLFALSAGCTVRFLKADVLPKNAYLQHMRAQKFFQIGNDIPKMNKNYSVDVDEFDAYEADEINQFPTDSTRISNSSSSSSSSSGSSNSNIPTGNRRESLEFKDIKHNLSTDELLNDDKERVNLMGGKTCAVSEKGILDVSIDSSNIFNLKKYMVALSPNSIIITSVDNDDNVMKTIPYESIKLPIETIEETRECWKIKTKEGKVFFCEKHKKDRDIWITNILKALFCYNTQTLTIENNMKDQRSLNIKIPKESTADQRIKNFSK